MYIKNPIAGRKAVLIDMGKSVRLISLFFCILFVFSGCLTVSASDVKAASKPDMGSRGEGAQKYFKVEDNNIIAVGARAGSDEINDAAADAGDAYIETGKAQMVYVPNGTHSITCSISIPEGVVLAGEKDCIYSVNEDISKVFRVYGSVYGGKFNGNNKAGQMIRFGEAKYKWPSGYVLYTTISDCSLQAILALGNINNVVVCNNTLKNALDGVCAMYGATIKLIDNNKISAMTQSGVDITHANAGTISNNTITNVKGHGISTDTEQNKDHAYVRITTVLANKISGSCHHGIYLEDNCKITGHVRSNVISNSALNGVCISKDASIGNIKNKKYFYENTIQGSTLSNISVGGKNSVLVMGSRNNVKNGKAAGITLGKAAKCYIYGSGNRVCDNGKNGIQMAEKSNFYVRGSGRTYITGNRWGINMNKGAVTNLKNTTIKSNSKGAVYYIAGATLKYEKANCKISGKIYKKS